MPCFCSNLTKHSRAVTYARKYFADWSKKNKDWDSVCIVANSVVSNRQARSATKAYLKYKLGLTLTDGELKTISHLAAPVATEGGQA
jgi:hypothetical protein